MRIATYDRCVEDCLWALARFAAPAQRDELLRLVDMPTAGPDGYPTSSMPESDVSHHGGGDPAGESVARSVDAANYPDAVRDARYAGPDDARVAASDDDEPSGRPFDGDLVAKLVDQVLAELIEARGLLVRSGRALGLLARRGDGRSGRQTTAGNCLVCDRPVSGAVDDRMRAGLCPSDSRAWYRFLHAASERGAFADPVEFRAWRRRTISPVTR